MLRGDTKSRQPSTEPVPPAGAGVRIPIVFVIGTLNIGGAETQLVEMVVNLDRRFAPVVCCVTTGPLARTLDAAGVPVVVLGPGDALHERRIPVPGVFVRVPRAMVRLIRCLRSHGALIVHGVLLHSYVLAAIAGRVAGVPVVVASRRSLSLFKHGRPLLRLGERVTNPMTDLVIANSEAVRRDALATEGLPPDKVIVIYNGLDAARYACPPPDALKDALDLGTGPVAIVISNFIAYKGYEYFLRAWAEVCARFPDAVALLVGDGPVRPDAETEARRLGIEPRLRFLGTRRDIPELLACADVLVHASLQEGFSNALLEAMAASRPVVATDVGGNREAVVEGVTGRLVPPANAHALALAITDVVERPDRGASMGRAGRARVLERFQRSRMIDEYEAAYDELLARRVTGHVRHQRAV